MEKNKEAINRMSPQGKGKPSDSGKSKAEVKKVTEKDALDRSEEITEKYLDEEDTPGQNVRQLHRNRNTDKPDIDKPAYGSS